MEGTVRKLLILTSFWQHVSRYPGNLFCDLRGCMAWPPHRIVVTTVFGTGLAMIAAMVYGKLNTWANQKLYGRLDNTLTQLANSLFSQLPELIEEIKFMTLLPMSLALDCA